AAFVCDVGNDILYGATPAAIERWIERDFDRLLVCGARVALMSLPLTSIDRLSPRRYRIIRPIFYPSRRVSFRQAVDQSHHVDERISALARSRGIAVVTPRAEWYGWDPIHIRRSARAAAWSSFLGTLLPIDPTLVRPQRRAVAWRLVPGERRIFGYA